MVGRQVHSGLGYGTKVRRIEVILSGNPDQREEGITPCISEGGSHSLRRGNIGNLAHRPFGGDPFAGRMSKDGREAKEAGFFVNSRGLDGRDLMSAKALADNVQPARQRGVAESAVSISGKGRPDNSNQ